MMAEQQANTGDKQQSYFRGYWSIKDVKDRVQRLSEWMKANRPSCRQLTLKGPDHDLIRRWPKAAGLLGFKVDESGVTFDGFELKRDNKPARYAK